MVKSIALDKITRAFYFGCALAFKAKGGSESSAVKTARGKNKEARTVGSCFFVFAIN
jgi:hypothetical protein